MCDEYPRWDVTGFLTTEERACLYLKAATEDDLGHGDTIRLAWMDVQRAHEAGKISINMAMSAEELSRILKSHGLCAAVIRKITGALLLNMQVMTLPMAA